METKTVKKIKQTTFFDVIGIVDELLKNESKLAKEMWDDTNILDSVENEINKQNVALALNRGILFVYSRGVSTGCLDIPISVIAETVKYYLVDILNLKSHINSTILGIIYDLFVCIPEEYNPEITPKENAKNIGLRRMLKTKNM